MHFRGKIQLYNKKMLMSHFNCLQILKQNDNYPALSYKGPCMHVIQ